MEAAVQLDNAAQLVDAKKWNEALAIYREVAAGTPNTPSAEFAQRQIPVIERQAARASGAKPALLPKGGAAGVDIKVKADCGGEGESVPSTR